MLHHLVRNVYATLLRCETEGLGYVERFGDVVPVRVAPCTGILESRSSCRACNLQDERQSVVEDLC